MFHRKKNSVIYKTVRGTVMKLVAYNRSLELCARMNYEVENLDFIDIMPEGSVFYDLGACEGRFAIYAALNGHKVLAFEPEKNNFEALSENCFLNNITEKRLIKFNIGVGAKINTVVLKIGQPWAGGHQKVVDYDQVREDLKFDFIEKQEIQIVSLDDYIKSKQLPDPGYMKIDIDGSEVPFIKGARKTLSNKYLKAIIFELNMSDKNSDFIILELKKCGFDFKKRFQIRNEKNLYNVVFSRV